MLDFRVYFVAEGEFNLVFNSDKKIILFLLLTLEIQKAP